MNSAENATKLRKVYILDEETAERVVRLSYQLAEALDVIIFNREKVIKASDEFERRLCGQLKRDVDWAKLDEIF